MTNLSPAEAQHLERVYKDTHWGKRGHRRPFNATLPDVSRGVVVLGHLVEIVYATRKGFDSRLVEYEHHFDAPFPVLAFAPDGEKKGLVIVRDLGRLRSRYTVTSRGIVG